MRTHQLLARKYSLSADDIGMAFARDLKLDARIRHRFETALARWQARPGRRTRDALLDACLTVLEALKAIILSPAAASATENIYQKRHIAAGIPSIYGNYSEPRFDALGLSFRVENLLSRLLDDVVAEGIELYVTRASLRRMQRGPAALRARARRRRRRLARPRREPRHARVQLRAAQLHLPPVPERLPVPGQQRHRAVVDVGPQPRAGAARRPRQRPAAVRGARPVGGRRRRARAPRGARLRRRPAGPRPLRVGGPAPDLAAQRPPRQPWAHAHDELRPRAAGLAHPQAQARHRRPDDARLQGARSQADDRLRPPGARGLRAQHRALRRHAGDVVPAALRRHHPPRTARRSARWSGRSACASATRASCCCSPSAPARRSPCRA